MTNWAVVSAVAAAVSALVAVTGGLVSIVYWLRTKGEHEEAARQAGIATDAAAATSEAVQQLAQLRQGQEQRAQAQLSAEERKPWSIERVSDAVADLANHSSTAKHGITVKLFANDDAFSTDEFDFIGPHRSERTTYINFGNAYVRAVITWHLREDCTDDIPPQTITW